MKLITRFIILFLFASMAAVSTHGNLSAKLKEPATEPPDVFQIVSLSDGSLCVLTADEKGIFFSRDGGMGWKQSRQVPEGSLYGIYKNEDDFLFLTSAEGVFRSGDSGESWQKVSDLNVAFISFDPEGVGCLVKVWGKGVFTAPAAYFDPGSETGATLVKEREITDGMSPTDGLPDFPAQTAAWGRGGRVYVGYFGKGVYGSSDGGRTWAAVNQGLTNQYVIVLARSPEGELFAGTYGGGLYRLLEREAIWRPVVTGSEDIATSIVQAIAFLPDTLVAAGSQDRGPFILGRSDGRVVTGPDDSMAKTTIHCLAVDNSGHIFAGTHSRGLFVSRDRGHGWNYLPFAYLAYVNRITVGGDGTWYVSVRGLGVLRSRDGGNSWTTVQLPFAFDPHLSLVTDLVGNLYAGTRDTNIFTSKMGIGPWEKFMDGFPDMGVGSLRRGPTGVLYATTGDGMGLYRSRQDRQGWEKIVAEGQYGENYDCWDIRFPPIHGAIAHGLQDILIRNPNSDRWERTRFGQHFRNLWMSSDGKILTERMISTFVLQEDGEWELTDRIPPERYTSFGWIDDARVAAIRMEGGVDLLHITDDRKLRRISRGIQDKKVLSIEVDGESGTILAGCESGLWICREPFDNWQEVEIGQGMHP